MEFLELQGAKTQVAGAQSPWLQFHLGQSHGYYGTANRLNLRKDGSGNGDKGVTSLRPTLQKSLSNVEARASSSSKSRLNIQGRGVNDQNASFEKLWWIARNEKVGGSMPSLKPWDETRGSGKKSASSVVLPSVNPTKQSTKSEGVRSRSANNRLLGLTRTDHGLPIPKKNPHNNYVEFRNYPDSDKIARLGELTRMGSSLGARLGTGAALSSSDYVYKGATSMKLKHFGVRKNTPNSDGSDSGQELDLKGRPHTAPDNLQRLPHIKNSDSGQGEHGTENGYIVNGNFDPENNTPSAKGQPTIDSDSGRNSATDASVSSSHVDEASTKNTRLPSNNGRDSPRLYDPQADDHLVDNEESTSESSNNTQCHNQQELPADKMSRANLSMSEFFCITVDPNSMSKSGICVYPGDGDQEGQFTSVQDDIERKRRVRFSISHEIREYQPWEPIDNVADIEEAQRSPTPLPDPENGPGFQGVDLNGSPNQPNHAVTNS